jgi:hypothetical protein
MKEIFLFPGSAWERDHHPSFILHTSYFILFYSTVVAAGKEPKISNRNVFFCN